MRCRHPDPTVGGGDRRAPLPCAGSARAREVSSHSEPPVAVYRAPQKPSELAERHDRALPTPGDHRHQQRSRPALTGLRLQLTRESAPQPTAHPETGAPGLRRPANGQPDITVRAARPGPDGRGDQDGTEAPPDPGRTAPGGWSGSCPQHEVVHRAAENILMSTAASGDPRCMTNSSASFARRGAAGCTSRCGRPMLPAFLLLGTALALAGPATLSFADAIGPPVALAETARPGAGSVEAVRLPLAVGETTRSPTDLGEGAGPSAERLAGEVSFAAGAASASPGTTMLAAGTAATPDGGAGPGHPDRTNDPPRSAVVSPHDPRRSVRSAAEGRFVWPLHPPPPVVRGFDPPESPYGAGHRGVDLGASIGQPVLAAGAGVVVFAGQVAGRGVISIDHDAIRTTYEPVRPEVSAGDQVYAGQRIGTVVASHRGCPGVCLHWGARRDKPPEYLDPLELLRSQSVIRLKPWPRDADD